MFPGNFQVAIYIRGTTLLASILAWTGPSSSCYILLEIRVKGSFSPAVMRTFQKDEIDMRCVQPPPLPRSRAHSIGFRQALPTQSSSLLDAWLPNLSHLPPHFPFPTKRRSWTLCLLIETLSTNTKAFLQQRRRHVSPESPQRLASLGLVG